MAVEFKLPDVGEGIAEGEIVQWLVAEGDEVSEDQPVVEIETDKALVEIPSPVDGVVAELRVEPGDIVPVGTVIVVFTETGEDSGDEAVGESVEEEAVESDAGSGERKEQTGRVFASPGVRQLARELDMDISVVRGTGPAGRVTEGDVQSAAAGSVESEQPGSVERERQSGTDSESDQRVRSGDTSRSRTLAAPATRRVASELGVDIDMVPAVDYRDGEAFVTPEAVRAFAETGQVTESGVSRTSREIDRIPYRGLRRTIGEQMERSAFTAPHVTHHDMADATQLVEIRTQLTEYAADREVRVTYLPFVLKSVVGALKEFPALNAELDEDAGEIIQKQEYNIGFATATDAGLLVPVIDDVDSKSIVELAVEAEELAAKARDRSITRDEMQGGTFTVTNFGAIGGEYATPIINYPEVAILGLGAIEKRPRVVGETVEARETVPLSLSIDHRVVDGVDAARFTNRVIEYIEHPMQLLLE